MDLKKLYLLEVEGYIKVTFKLFDIFYKFEVKGSNLIELGSSCIILLKGDRHTAGRGINSIKCYVTIFCNNF